MEVTQKWYAFPLRKFETCDATMPHSMFNADKYSNSLLSWR